MPVETEFQASPIASKGKIDKYVNGEPRIDLRSENESVSEDDDYFKIKKPNSKPKSNRLSSKKKSISKFMRKNTSGDLDHISEEDEEGKFS